MTTHYQITEFGIFQGIIFSEVREEDMFLDGDKEVHQYHVYGEWQG